MMETILEMIAKAMGFIDYMLFSFVLGLAIGVGFMVVEYVFNAIFKVVKFTIKMAGKVWSRLKKR